jgi:CubicO group peptidase (beta-lactamase class C family)
MSNITRLCLSLLLSLSFSAGLVQGQTPGGLAAEFDRIVAAEFKAEEPGGVVLVARKGEVIYRKALGMANIELGVPMKEEMVFNIGSITKQFTAVAILQLMERGRLSLQDEVTKYLPDYPAGGQKMTVENLLTHTAGIPASAPEAMLSLQAPVGATATTAICYWARSSKKSPASPTPSTSKKTSSSRRA